MKNIKKRPLIIATLLICVTIISTACGGKTTATKISELVSGHLDALYLGEASEDYLEQLEVTAEQIQEEYMDAIKTESAFFCNYIGAIEKPEYYETLPPATRVKVEELYQEIYKTAKYEVRDPQEMEEDKYSVEVVVQPIDAVDKAFDELNSQDYQPFIDLVSKYNTGEMTEEEFFIGHAEMMTELVSSKLAEGTYLDPETVIVNVDVDQEGNFTVNPDDLITVDSKIISYGNLDYTLEDDE